MEISEITSLELPCYNGIVELAPGRNVVHIDRVVKSFSERGFRNHEGTIYAEGEGFFFVAEGFESQPFGSISEVRDALNAKLEELSLA